MPATQDQLNAAAQVMLDASNVLLADMSAKPPVGSAKLLADRKAVQDAIDAYNTLAAQP